MKLEQFEAILLVDCRRLKIQSTGGIKRLQT